MIRCFAQKKYWLQILMSFRHNNQDWWAPENVAPFSIKMSLGFVFIKSMSYNHIYASWDINCHLDKTFFCAMICFVLSVVGTFFKTLSSRWDEGSGVAGARGQGLLHRQPDPGAASGTPGGCWKGRVGCCISFLMLSFLGARSEAGGCWPGRWRYFKWLS